MSLLATGCAAIDDPRPDPVTRTFTWFSYLNGDDIRRGCAVGSANRLRLVYNAVNVEQVRTYDLRRVGEGDALDIRVLLPADLSGWAVSGASGLLDPWRGQEAKVFLRPSDSDLLWRTVRDAQALPPGSELPAWEFWWIAVGCLEGEMGFKAFLWPRPGYPEKSFAALLAAWDPTGIPFNSPRPTDRNSVYGMGQDHQDSARIFRLRVEKDGLFSARPLFGR